MVHKTGEDVIQEMRILRFEQDWTYQSIADRFGCDATTVRRYAQDGRFIQPQRELSQTASAIDKRKRRQDPEYHARDLADSRAWKERNKERVAAYAVERRLERKHKANGSPPPKKAKTCACPIPNKDDDGYCGFCGDLVAEKGWKDDEA